MAYGAMDPNELVLGTRLLMEIASDRLRGERASSPLSYTQLRLWRAQKPPETYIVLRLRGHVDDTSMRKAFAWLVRRHEALRTTYRASATDEPSAIVAPASSDAALMNVSFSEQFTDNSKIVRAASEAVRRLVGLLDLSQGRVFLGELIRTSTNDQLMVLCAHHLAVDGISMLVLADELGEGYSECVLGSPLNSPPEAVTFGDYALWQRRWLSGNRLDYLLSLWRDQWGSPPPLLRLPSQSRPEEGSVAGEDGAGNLTDEFCLTDEVAEALVDMGKALRTSLFCVVASAVYAVASLYSGDTEVVVATTAANRTRQPLTTMIGCFADFLPVRITLEGNPSFLEVVARCAAAVAASSRRLDLPFTRMAMSIPRDGEASSGHSHPTERRRSLGDLFQILIDYHVARPLRSRFGGLQVTGLPRATSLERIEGLAFRASVAVASGSIRVTTIEDADLSGLFGIGFAEALRQTLDAVASDQHLTITELGGRLRRNRPATAARLAIA